MSLVYVFTQNGEVLFVMWRALLFIDNRQFVGFLHKQNLAASTDINFIVTYLA